MSTRRNARRRARGPHILIFAYGSNLDPDQMARRCSSARIIGPAYLHGYRLEFRGWSIAWDGAVANVAPARGQCVPGVVYLCRPSDIWALDRCEGHPSVYRRQTVDVVTDEGRKIRAQAYIMRKPPGINGPSAEYFRAIYRGYVVWGLPVRALTNAVKNGRRRYRRPARRQEKLW